MSTRAALAERVVVADGAMGTMLQASDATGEDFAGYEGCNEILNVTRPDIVTGVHDAYLEAGADCVTTNSFGANLGNLGEYGITERIGELSEASARLARAAADRWATPDRPRWVLGSIGPGTKLPTLGHITFRELRDSYQANAHIAALTSRLAGRPAVRRRPRPEPGVASLYVHVPFRQDTAFLAIGERTNANGSKAFRDAMLEGLHGLSVQLTEALAEYWHTRVRRELDVGGADPGDLAGFFRVDCRGARYSFGYPACPDLADRAEVMRLLEPSRIGVELSEEMQLHPEQSTDAIVVHHPEAKYFSV